jgi:hypothetical protein
METIDEVSRKQDMLDKSEILPLLDQIDEILEKKKNEE